MKAKLVTKQDFEALLNALIGKGKVVGVKEKENGKFHFAALANAKDLKLGYDVTVTPPKRFIQPPKETLVEFTLGKSPKPKAVVETEEMVIVGVHPYDMKAINQMDKVFTDDNKDTNYLERRKKISIIGIDPTSAGKWAFWGSMNSAVVDKGFDLWLTDMGDKYFVEIGSDKGEAMLAGIKTSAAIESDIKQREESRKKLATLCKADRKMKTPAKDLYNLFKKSYDSKLWDEKAEKCYSCGSCNLVCPTCYCFDVREDVDLSLMSGKRVRYWDGCLLEDFAKVGSGENFREERPHRYRHRLLRKMEYMVDKIGETACVGCGRCSSVCLPDIADPVKIANELSK